MGSVGDEKRLADLRRAAAAIGLLAVVFGAETDLPGEGIRRTVDGLTEIAIPGFRLMFRDLPDDAAFFMAGDLLSDFMNTPGASSSPIRFQPFARPTGRVIVFSDEALGQLLSVAPPAAPDCAPTRRPNRRERRRSEKAARRAERQTRRRVA